MARIWLLGLLVFAVPTLLASRQQPPKPTEPIWTWFGRCAEKRYMRMEISDHGKLIYGASFPICPIRKNSEESGKVVAFHFKGGRSFGDEFQTSRQETLEGNIWEAGSDPGYIIFGMSFWNTKREFLNALYMAKAEGESSEEIDRELIVHTFPTAVPKKP